MFAFLLLIYLCQSNFQTQPGTLRGLRKTFSSPTVGRSWFILKLKKSRLRGSPSHCSSKAQRLPGKQPYPQAGSLEYHPSLGASLGLERGALGLPGQPLSPPSSQSCSAAGGPCTSDSPPPERRICSFLRDWSRLPWEPCTKRSNDHSAVQDGQKLELWCYKDLF